MKACVVFVGIAVGFASHCANAQMFNDAYVADQFEAKRAQRSSTPTPEQWFQPRNQTGKCEVALWGTETPSKVMWYGKCRNGRAEGLGIEVMVFPATDAHPTGTGVTLVEFTDHGEVDYRSVTWGDGRAQILKGRMLRNSRLVEALVVGKTPKGHITLEQDQMHCSDDGECVTRQVDPTSGSALYTLHGPNGYDVRWAEVRVDNQLLFNRRWLLLDNATPLEKYVFDDTVVDSYSDLRSGKRGRVNFGDRTNSMLALPFETFASFSSDLATAISHADAKFAQARDHYCVAPKDPDVRKFCDPSDLIPSEAALADARAETDEGKRSFYQSLQRALAQGQAVDAQQRQQQQQAVNDERRREENREALRRGFEAINQAAMNAQQAAGQMQQGFVAPQVQTQTLSGTGVIQCRTIGYITYCN